MKLRKPCIDCEGETGHTKEKNGQVLVYCDDCDRWQYNQPKAESVRRPSGDRQRARLMLRANGCCEICGVVGVHAQLDLAHVISVADGKRHKVDPGLLRSDENLLVTCAACNQGIGNQTIQISLVFRIAWLNARSIG